MPPANARKATMYVASDGHPSAMVPQELVCSHLRRIWQTMSESIERNAIATVKAINAAPMALRGDASHYVSLDKVIMTMREMGADMLTKYEKTARRSGGPCRQMLGGALARHNGVAAHPHLGADRKIGRGGLRDGSRRAIGHTNVDKIQGLRPGLLLDFISPDSAANGAYHRHCLLASSGTDLVTEHATEQPAGNGTQAGPAALLA